MKAMIDREKYARDSVFWITSHIAQGGFPIEETVELLKRAGVTHLLNLDQPMIGRAPLDSMGIEMLHVPLVDGRRLPNDKTLECLDALHDVLMNVGGKIFIFCYAGMNRSPTIVWLYFVALGESFEEAAARIVDASPHAVPGHAALVDRALLDHVVAHGEANYRPPPRPETVAPPVVA
jgi:protein-tyrosine phosphatase